MFLLAIEVEAYERPRRGCETLPTASVVATLPTYALTCELFHLVCTVVSSEENVVICSQFSMPY